MASSTRQSRQALQGKLDSLQGVDLTLAKQLFAIANSLQQSAQLRSLLSDPSAEQAGKEKAIDAVFGMSDAKAKDLLKTASAMRFSATRDLASTFEVLGVRALASQSKDLDQLQTQLFELQQLSGTDPELELALSSTRASAEGKEALVGKLVSGKVSEAAEVLARQAVYSRSFKRFAQVLEQYGLWIAEFAGESVAHIRVARALDASQLQRLGAALAKAFGRELQLNVEVDEEIIGGVHVTVNGEVIDGTVLTKLINARLQLG
jgi:F-type H+-transporting ATPase subunit delta